MAVVIDQIEASVLQAPVTTGADQQQSEQHAIDPAEVRRTLAILRERAARLEDA